MQRISINEDDLDGGAGRTPAVYAPVGGKRQPAVYGPADAPNGSAGTRGAPWWLVVVIALVAALTVGVAAFFVARSGRVPESTVQRELAAQKATLQHEAEQAQAQAVAATKQAARDDAAARARSDVRAARAEGRRAGYQDGYEAGLQAGRGETCTGLLC